MSKKRDYYSHKKTDRKHEPQVDLKKHKVRLGSETYKWEDLPDGLGLGTNRFWSRVSKSRCKKNMHEVAYVREDKRNHKKHEWEDALRPLSDKCKDRHLERELERLVLREVSRPEREEKERLKQAYKDVTLLEAPRHEEIEESDSEEPEASDSGEEIHRDKHGVRLYSNDEKHFFNLGVYKSRNYPGCSTVSLFSAGRALTYTLNKRKMEALIREVTRTFSGKDLRRIFEL